jgi:SAM-dependent methyltransferase
MLRDRVLKVLRGTHTSVRHKFTTLPYTHLKFELYKLTGGNWTDFYRKMVDDSARTANLSDEQVEAAIKSVKFQFDFILRRGLEPHHRFLDYGCGRMRMGTYVVPYLTSGHYVGADISSEVVALGLQLLRKRGVPPEKFEGVTLSDCRLTELSGRQFDFVWANSVVTHMPEAEVAEMLASMRPLIAKGGKYVFSYSTAERPTRLSFKDYFYPTETIERLVTNAGYRFTPADDYDSPMSYDAMAVSPFAVAKMAIAEPL